MQSQILLQLFTFYFATLSMIRDLKAFYVAIIDNEVICFDTNLKLFIEQFTKLESGSRNYDWFYREFKKHNRFNMAIGEKEYYFQKLV